jgi:hypothetical protein
VAKVVTSYRQFPEQMQNILYSLLLISMFTFSSCATYRNGQTPDDVYFAAVPELDNYVSFDNDRERITSNREDRQIRMQIYDRRFRSLNDPFCHDPSSIIIRNNHCYCPSNGAIVPFIPGSRIVHTPTLQPGLSSISTNIGREPINTGKYIIPAQPSNGSNYFRGATNQNQTRYAPYNNNSENNGSRFFNSNPSGSPSGNFGSGGGSSRSGRRN